MPANNTSQNRVRAMAVPAAVFLLVLIIFRFILFFGAVPTTSMEPSLPEGSFIFGTRIYGALDDGDIIVFRHDGLLLVKRIVYAPGDEIDWTDFECAANGTEDLPRTVPDDAYIVMGDNREESLDSRSWTEPFIASDDIVAVIFTTS